MVIFPNSHENYYPKWKSIDRVEVKYHEDKLIKLTPLLCDADSVELVEDDLDSLCSIKNLIRMKDFTANINLKHYYTH